MELELQAMMKAALSNLQNLTEDAKRLDDDMASVQEEHDDAERNLQITKAKLQEAKQHREDAFSKVQMLREQVYQPLEAAYLCSKQMDEEWTTQVSTGGKAPRVGHSSPEPASSDTL
jgi:predicted  nucleic acid-binding Zn-ribbon protein